MVKVADLEAYSPAFLLAQMFCFLIPKIKWSHKLNHKLLNIVLYPMSCEPKKSFLSKVASVSYFVPVKGTLTMMSWPSGQGVAC